MRLLLAAIARWKGSPFFDDVVDLVVRVHLALLCCSGVSVSTAPAAAPLPPHDACAKSRAVPTPLVRKHGRRETPAHTRATHAACFALASHPALGHGTAPHGNGATRAEMGRSDGKSILLRRLALLEREKMILTPRFVIGISSQTWAN